MRCKTFTLIPAVVFVCLFASRAQAQKAAWAADFPKAGNKGEILVKGTSTPSANHTLTGKGSSTYWLKSPNGAPVLVKVNITVAANGDWSGTITGLQPGKEYNVVIAIFEKNDADAQFAISPDPKSKAAGN